MSTGRFRGAMPLNPEVAEMRLAGLADVIGARVHVDVVVPRTQIAGKMRLLSRSEMGEARVATLHALAQLGIDKATPSHIFVEEWNAEFNARVLSLAVREPKDATRQLASIEEWRECDDDQIVALFVQYNDLANKIDPLGETVELTPDEIAAMTSAAKKKLADTLLSYGSRKLALFAISLAAPPAS